LELKLYFRMLQRNWWLILLTAMVALIVSLLLSYAAIPQYQSTARFVISPSPSLTSGGDVVRSLDTLDRRSVGATYAEIMNSTRVFDDASKFIKIDPSVLSKNYKIQAVVLPDSSVLELSVFGPDSGIAADLANSVGYQTINFTRSLNLVYDLNFLDTAVPTNDPISPVPVRDGLVSMVLGIAVGAILAILSEQLRIPLESYRQRLRIDNVTNLYNNRYFRELLNTKLSNDPDDVLSVGIVELKGLRDYSGSLPLSGLHSLLREATDILQKELRGHDVVGRWDDVSFIVMLPSTPGTAAKRTFDRIYQALSKEVNLKGYDIELNLDPHIGGAVYSNLITSRELIAKAVESLEQARSQSETPVFLWTMNSPFWVER